MSSAVVTGAAMGIGRAVAERLVDDGHHVVALGWWYFRHTKQPNTPGEITLWINRRWQIDAYVPRCT